MRIRNEQVVAMRKKYVGDRLLRIFDGTRHSASWDSQNASILVKDPLNQITRLAFDAHGFLGAITSPLNRTWSLENATDGKLQGLRNPAGNHLEFEYGESGSLIGVLRNSTKLFAVSQDATGRPAAITYPDQTSVYFAYDHESRICGIKNRLGSEDIYDRAEDGRIITILDGNRNKTSFHYSKWSRPDSLTYADGSDERYQYDPQGLVSRVTYDDNTDAKIEYDTAKRPTRISYDDGETITFKYDFFGNVTEAKNSLCTSRYVYDEERRVVSETQNESLLRFEYNSAGVLSKLTYPSGKEAVFHYDADLRPISIVAWDGHAYQFKYSADDKTVTTYFPNQLVSETTSLTSGLLDAVHLLGRDGTEVASFAYQYDKQDRLIAFHDSDYSARFYEYDAESQIRSVSVTDGSQRERYSYDPAGNRIWSNGQRATFNSLNQLTAQGDLSCAYDPRGNLTLRRGQGMEWRYTYNSRNLLVQAIGPGGVDIRFGYDAFGRRLFKRSGEVLTHYLWAGEHLIGEISRSNHGTVLQEYLYAPSSFVPLAKNVNGKIYCYHTNHIGTPLKITDEGGAVVWSADYDAFGMAFVGDSTVVNDLRLPGHYFDFETGLHYNRFRYYAPDLGRYNTRDPVTFLAGTNFYTYVGNNPINTTDAVGLWWPGWGAVAGIAVGVIVAGALIAAAPLVLGAAAAVTAGTLLSAAVASTAIVIGGAAGGAVAYGLNEGFEHGFTAKCWSEARRGAGIGALASLPFAAIPLLPFVAPVGLATFAAGTAGYTVAGGISGAIGYASDIATSSAHWNWWNFGTAVVLSMLTAGTFRFLAGRLSAERPAPEPEPTSTYAPRSPETDAAALKVDTALQRAGYGPEARPTIGVAKSGDNYRVALSGESAKVNNAAAQLQGKLPPDYTVVKTSPDVPLETALKPDGTPFPGGKTCVEPKLYSDSRATGNPIESMSVYNPSEGQFITPCESCNLNQPAIVSGRSVSPQASMGAAASPYSGAVLPSKNEDKR